MMTNEEAEEVIKRLEAKCKRITEYLEEIEKAAQDAIDHLEDVDEAGGES